MRNMNRRANRMAARRGGIRPRMAASATRARVWTVARQSRKEYSTTHTPPMGSDPGALKEAGYRFWRANFVTDEHWRVLMDEWYNETVLVQKEIKGNDYLNKSIMSNTGFVKLVNCSVAAQGGSDISKEIAKCSPSTSATKDGFCWHYAYPGVGNPAAEGISAYDSATHFLGSYTGKLRLLNGIPGQRGICKYEVTINNTSGWTSGTRLPGFAANAVRKLQSWLPEFMVPSNWDPVSLFKDHRQGRNDLYPISGKSKGGNYRQEFKFEYETDCCAQCQLP